VSEARVAPFDDKPGPDGIAVRGYLHIPPAASGDGLVLTHGAGANCNSDLLKALATEFCASGYTVLRCDLPFRQARPYGPPSRGSAERDQAGLRRAVELVRKQVGARVFLAGHSYGGRQSSILAASDPELAHGLLLLSYPLHPPGKPEQLRTAHFPKLRTPAFFVHGSHDDFGSIEEMRAALKLIPAKTKLLPVEGAGHSLMTKKDGAGVPGKISRAFQQAMVRMI
jgi:uncharacterized protein